MRNIELKARWTDLDSLRGRLPALGARPEAVFTQRDTYFAARRGRLKLREARGRTAELIAYHRPDERESRVSDYAIAPVENPEALGRLLEQALGIRAVVVKRREVWLLEHTRIHLDQVAGLGTFVELETVTDAVPEATARAEFERVAGALGIPLEARIAVSYADLPPASGEEA